MEITNSFGESSGYSVANNEELVEVVGGKSVGSATDCWGIMWSK
jgi:hypothetical protein